MTQPFSLGVTHFSCGDTESTSALCLELWFSVMFGTRTPWIAGYVFLAVAVVVFFHAVYKLKVLATETQNYSSEIAFLIIITTCFVSRHA